MVRNHVGLSRDSMWDRLLIKVKVVVTHVGPVGRGMTTAVLDVLHLAFHKEAVFAVGCDDVTGDFMSIPLAFNRNTTGSSIHVLSRAKSHLD